MNAALKEIRARLIKRWEEIPDGPPAAEVDALCLLADRLVHLIGWIDERPAATREEYRAELAIVMHAEWRWPAGRGGAA